MLTWKRQKSRIIILTNIAKKQNIILTYTVQLFGCDQQ